MINRFRDEYDFLSNFYLEPTGMTVEHRFQSAKTLDAVERAAIWAAPTPGEAKARGRRVTLRPDWEDVKVRVMRAALQHKFVDETLRGRLMETGYQELVEGNTWSDTFWGVDLNINSGQNVLGFLLMQLREEIRTGVSVDLAYPWVDGNGDRWSDFSGGTRIREKDGVSAEWAGVHDLIWDARRTALNG